MKIYRMAIPIIVFLAILSAVDAVNGQTEGPRGLKYSEIHLGAGKQAVRGRVADIHFRVWMNENGEKGTLLFDSYAENFPISFKVGTPRIADGLNLGVNGMKVGGTRRLFVPPGLSPKKASGEFPANANLIFEVELLKVE